MLRKALLVFILLLNLGLSYCQQINRIDLLRRKIKEVKIYSYDSISGRQLKALLYIDLDTYTINRINIERSNGHVDTTLEISKFNSNLQIISIESKSKNAYSMFIYTYPTNDTSITSGWSKSEFFLPDSLGNLKMVNSKETSSSWKTIYNKTSRKVIERDDNGVIKEIKTIVKGRKTITTLKNYRRNSNPKKTKWIYIDNGTTTSQIGYFSYPKGISSCKKLITNRIIEFNDDGMIKKELLQINHCAPSTEEYEFEYIY
jgi:hypothetical protein